MKKVKNSDLNLVLQFIDHARKSDYKYLEINDDKMSPYMEGKHFVYDKVEKFIIDLCNEK